MTYFSRLTYLLFCVIVTSRGDSLEACFNSSLSRDLKEWPLHPSGDTVQVVWSFDKVCGDVSQCYGSDSNTSVEFIKFNQLPPVQIRPDQFIQFRLDNAKAQSVQLNFFRVDGASFESCMANADQQIEITDDTLLGVGKGLLTVGNNYFIANSFNVTPSYWKCFPYGLRVNITVQTNNCGRDPNVSQQCNARGRCLAKRYEPKYNCHCCPGFAGDYCDSVDGCFGIECEHGGTCVDGQDGGSQPTLTCLCIPGFTGTRCETLMGTPCITSECMHNGICVEYNDTQSQRNFKCFCPFGYTGKVCETNIDECQSNPCISGTCGDLVNGYNCTCDPEYTGSRCETFIGLCPVGRCRNAGTCIEIPETKDSICRCLQGFTGASCETRVELCHPEMCNNSIDCVDYGDRFQCVCTPGFAGVYCEIDVDECASNPCLNGGTCHDEVARFSCECPEELRQWTTCEVPSAGNSTLLRDANANAKDNTMVGLTIALAVIGTLLGVAIIVVLIYCCAVHKPYKQLRLRKKYLHVVDETYGPSGSFDSGDVQSGAHPSPDFVTEPMADGDGSSTGSAKSPLVRRTKRPKPNRI